MISARTASVSVAIRTEGARSNPERGSESCARHLDAVYAPVRKTDPRCTSTSTAPTGRSEGRTRSDTRRWPAKPWSAMKSRSARPPPLFPPPPSATECARCTGDFSRCLRPRSRLRRAAWSADGEILAIVVFIEAAPRERPSEQISRQPRVTERRRGEIAQHAEREWGGLEAVRGLGQVVREQVDRARYWLDAGPFLTSRLRLAPSSYAFGVLRAPLIRGSLRCVFAGCRPGETVVTAPPNPNAIHGARAEPTRAPPAIAPPARPVHSGPRSPFEYIAGVPVAGKQGGESNRRPRGPHLDSSHQTL